MSLNIEFLFEFKNVIYLSAKESVSMATAFILYWDIISVLSFFVFVYGDRFLATVFHLPLFHILVLVNIEF